MTILLLIILFIMSCKHINNDIKYFTKNYDRLSRDNKFENIKCEKETRNLEDINFLVANYPDEVLSVESINNFDFMYDKLIKYISDCGYDIVYNEKLHHTATVIFKKNNSKNGYRYISILMQHNSRLNKTVYNIFYGGNKYKAKELYNEIYK